MWHRMLRIVCKLQNISWRTLMNRAAYSVHLDSVFRQMLIAPAPEKVPYAYAQYAGEGLSDILSVHLLAACTSSTKVFQPLTPLRRRLRVRVRDCFCLCLLQVQLNI